MLNERDKTSALIRIISEVSDRYGDKLVLFMEQYGLTGLNEATPEQLSEFIEQERIITNKEDFKC